MEVQLQPLNYMREITSMETHDVFGYTRRLRAESKRGRGGESEKDYMVSVAEYSE